MNVKPFHQTVLSISIPAPFTYHYRTKVIFLKYKHIYVAPLFKIPSFLPITFKMNAILLSTTYRLVMMWALLFSPSLLLSCLLTGPYFLTLGTLHILFPLPGIFFLPCNLFSYPTLFIIWILARCLFLDISPEPGTRNQEFSPEPTPCTSRPGWTSFLGVSFAVWA